MAIPSPLQHLHEQADAAFLRYGDERAIAPEVVASFGEVEGEYAAIRKGCALVDSPQRGTLRISGKDRLEFLGRMVTQELKGLAPWRARDTFWLNRKGRIEADLRLIETTDALWADTDALVASQAARSLVSFVFSEDVAIEDVTDRFHRLALHGPTSRLLLQQAGEPVAGAPAIASVGPGEATRLTIAGAPVLVDHQRAAGEDGFGLLVERDDALRVYERLLERGLEEAPTGGRVRLWPVGWHAFNIARIEAGTALFNVDFGGGNLPHESGILDERVSFTKGCYLGQEIVARMQALGHPKQRLIALRVGPPEGEKGDLDWQPVTGAPVRRADQPEGEPVGAVTSSTRSPMLGDAVACFAQVKWDASQPGTRLLIDTAAGPAPALVQEKLAFWRKSVTSSGR